MDSDAIIQERQRELDRALFACLDTLARGGEPLMNALTGSLGLAMQYQLALNEASPNKPTEIKEQYEILARELYGKVNYFVMVLMRYRQHKGWEPEPPTDEKTA